MAAWNEAPAAGELGECAALVRSAEALRFSAPELAVQLARRALIVGADSADAADLGQAKALSMHAQALLAAGLVRMSHYADAVEPAFAALALADGEGSSDAAMAVRLDLAACSREVGEPLLGCAVLRPVLETGQPSPSLRAVALGRLVGCVAHVGRRDDLEDILAEADRLLATDDGLSPDSRRLERARLSVRAAAYHRWYGDTEDATDAAREGLTQLNRLRGLRSETARVRAQLVLELVCALLDEGALEEAASVSEAVLAEPVRATSAAAVGRLMLAVSTRVHLPSGRAERGRGLLDQAVWVAGRHGLDGLLADVLTAVSELDEHAGRPVEALEALRNARAAEQRRLRSMSQAARRLLIEESPAGWDVKAVNSLLRSVVGAAAAHQPTQDWHLAAQRVTQSAKQRTRADQPAQHMPHPVSTATWPSEQPPAARLARRQARSNDEPAAARSTEDPAMPQAGGQPATARTSDQTAAAPSGAHLTAAGPGDGPATQSADRDEATGLLNKDGLIRRLHSVRNGERPMALALVRLDGDARSGPFADPGTRPGAAADFQLSELAGRVRNIAPENAELARSGGTELAVLLPHTTRDEAETFAAAIQSAWLTADGPNISTGVIQSDPDSPTVDARALINAARHALTPGVTEPSHRPHSSPGTVEELADLDDTGDTLRIGRAIISSLSIPAGSGGKRRAADSSTGPADATAPNTRADAQAEPTAPDAATHPTPGASMTSTRAADAVHLFPAGSLEPGASSSGESADIGAPPDQGSPSTRDTVDSPGAGEPDTGSREPEPPAGGETGADPAAEPGRVSTPDSVGGPGSGATAAGAGESTGSGVAFDREWPSPRDADGGADTSGDAGAAFDHGWPSARDADLNPEPGVAGTADVRGESTGGNAAGGHPAASGPDSAQRPDGTPGEPAGSPESVDSPGFGAAGPGRGVMPDSVESPNGGPGGSPESEPAAASSSTYEQTRAELALLMSSLAGGIVSPETPLPAPSRPTEDHPRNGTALPSQSIPTPPDPDEVPEPKPRPDIPDPGEPEPIPPAPPDPGPPPPDEPGPLIPPSAGTPDAGTPGAESGNAGTRDTSARRVSGTGTGTIRTRTSRLADAFGAGGHRSGTGTDRPRSPRAESNGSPADGAADPGRRERSSTTIAGLLAEALAAYQETADDPEPARRPEPPRDGFDRLFDWRYQSPASGRHRSPE